MDKYFDINSRCQNIHCKMYYNNNEKVNKVVLFGHGFAGHKDNGAAEKFASEVLANNKGIVVLVYNLPCHGDDEKKEINLQDCLTYMDIILDYIKSELCPEEIYSYATSFGGYLVLKYISEYGNPFVKIALRCPAVNMADVLTQTIMSKEELESVLQGKTVEVGFDRKIDVNAEFLSALQKADIQKVDYKEFADKILILHGRSDEVVPFEAGKCFAEKNGISFIPIDHCDHRFKNPGCMEVATEYIVDFLQL